MQKSENIMKNIKDDVSDNGNADVFCLRATQICDIQKQPGTRVRAETIVNIHTSTINGYFIFLDLSSFRLPDESHTSFFRKYILQNFSHTTLIKCKFQTESSTSDSHILIATLSKYRYPLFIFKYVNTIYNVNVYKLSAEIVPTDGERPKVTVNNRLPNNFIGLDP